MSELTLFLDSCETKYPGPVSELLIQAPRDAKSCATLTPDNQCVFICGNVMYIFPNKNDGIPAAFKLNLPNTGLLYSVKSVCVFRGSNNSIRPSVIAVSPEGVIRYWCDVSKHFMDKKLNLNNEVAFSICLFESSDYVHKFLISTTTVSTFYIVEIYHNAAGKSENLEFRSLEMNSAAGMGRRMSMLLFGSFAGEKELITKTLYVRGLLRTKDIDIVAIFPKVLRFYSFNSQSLLHEINIVEMFLAQYRDQQQKILANNVSILDANIYHKGLLLLLVVASSNERFVKAKFYLGYLKQKHDEREQYISIFIPIILPNDLTEMELSKFAMCKLLVTDIDECVIVLPNSLISVKNPSTEDVDAAVLDYIDDVILGAAVVEDLCHVILKNLGICALRRLPQYFDLKFWKKNQLLLKELIEDDLFCDVFLKKAFIAFCSKNLKEAKELSASFIKKSSNNIADLVVELDKYFIDNKPNDLRWNADETIINEDQCNWLKEQALIPKNFQIIFETLDDKLSQHNMFVLFLQQFGFLNKIDKPMNSYNGRSGIAILAEFGEKLILATLCLTWLSKQQQGSVLPIVFESIQYLSQEFIQRFQHSESPYLTIFDHVFNEIFYFSELIATVVRISDKKLKKLNLQPKKRLQVITEVGAFLSIMANGIFKAKEQEKILILPKETATWIHELLIHFIRYLNVAFEFLETHQDILDTDDQCNIVLEHNIKIAEFVLSHQERCRLENSQIIAQFLRINQIEIAIKLAESFQDFTTLVEYCHKNLSEKDCQDAMNKYKVKFEKYDFDLFLYDYYRKKKMVNYLLAEKGNRLNKFLSEHENINWIKNIDNEDYKKAYQTLKLMSYETNNNCKKLVILSFCKLCVLCEPNGDLGELAEISLNIRILSDKINNEKNDDVSITTIT